MKRMMGCLKWVGIGVGGVIILLILIAVFVPESDEPAAAEAEPAPAATEAPAATNTPAPTATAAATPTPEVTPTPATLEEAVKASIDRDGNRDVPRIALVEQDMDVINVEWAINDNMGGDLIRSGARLDAVHLLHAIHAYGAEYRLINLVGTFSMRDTYGNTSESPVVYLTFEWDTVQRINWDDEAFWQHSLQNQIYELADSTNIHEEFQ